MSKGGLWGAQAAIPPRPLRRARNRSRPTIRLRLPPGRPSRRCRTGGTVRTARSRPRRRGSALRPPSARRPPKIRSSLRRPRTLEGSAPRRRDNSMVISIAISAGVSSLPPICVSVSFHVPSKSASVTSVSAVPGSKTSASGLSRRKVRRILISGEETSSNAELSNTRLPSTGANFIAESSMVTITLSPRISHAPSSGSSPGFASSIPAIDRITAADRLHR